MVALQKDEYQSENQALQLADRLVRLHQERTLQQTQEMEDHTVRALLEVVFALLEEEQILALQEEESAPLEVDRLVEALQVEESAPLEVGQLVGASLEEESALLEVDQLVEALQEEESALPE